MDTSNWTSCTLRMNWLNLSEARLQERWAELHRGNNEPFPADAALQEVWRCYHLGKFPEGIKSAAALGDAGIIPLAFCATIHANYIEKDDNLKKSIFKQTIEICERAHSDGLSSANYHYIYAVTLGRYSQTMTPLEALSDGLVGRMKEQIDLCLALDDSHAECYATLAGWNAHVTSESGEMMAKMMYGATENNALGHYEKAVQCAPDSPIPYIEYAQGLEKLYGGETAGKRIRENLDIGLALKPADAMQQLDQINAAALLATLRKA